VESLAHFSSRETKLSLSPNIQTTTGTNKRFSQTPAPDGALLRAQQNKPHCCRRSRARLPSPRSAQPEAKRVRPRLHAAGGHCVLHEWALQLRGKNNKCAAEAKKPKQTHTHRSYSAMSILTPAFRSSK